jgi:2',3'-cyclic-nucleotide 2'-phosphodiesterase (5'-nucleotidase family)
VIYLIAISTFQIVFPGDFLGGSTFAAAHKGLSVLEVINCLDIDYFTLGNHEFDFGAANVGELMEKSNFKWLGSNVRHADSKALFHRVMDTDVFDVNISNKKNKNDVEGAECDQSAVKSSDCEADDSIRVGVFGVCTQFTPMLSDPGDEVVFEDVFEHSERCVKALRQQHCNFIIALTHLELENDKRIAEALDIDVIIGSTYYLITSL